MNKRKIASSYANNDEMEEEQIEERRDGYYQDILENHKLKVSNQYNSGVVRTITYNFDDLKAVWNLTNDYLIYFTNKDEHLRHDSKEWKNVEYSNDKVSAFERACEEGLYDDYKDFVKHDKELTAFEKGIIRGSLEDDIIAMEKTMTDDKKREFFRNEEISGHDLVRSAIRKKEKIIKKLEVFND